ncbi:hypothetical protein AB0B89_26670 [Sphaerisporangium sp. NPDC049002]
MWTPGSRPPPLLAAALFVVGLGHGLVIPSMSAAIYRVLRASLGN